MNIHFQITNFVSSALIGGGNVTVSTLTYTPRPIDHGKLLTCIATVEGVPNSTVEDTRRLIVHCKFGFSCFFLDSFLGNFVLWLGLLLSREQGPNIAY